jgi:V/A-type H+-transporting ATPase subunit F
MQGKTAIIGNLDSILAFKAGGVDAYGVTTAQEAKDALKKLAKNYAVIFITDDFAAELDDYLKRFLESAYPVIVPVPSKNGNNGYSTKKLKEQMERALGVDILFRN